MIVVHAGAGYHSETKEETYKAICREACEEGIKFLKNGASALDCVTVVVKYLEDSPYTNAGIGSNMTIEGCVECDASVMDGYSLQFGAVGSTSGVRNPVEVARLLVEKQKEGNMSLGRIPPSILVGDGVQKWLQENRISLATGNLITEDSKRIYEKHKRKLEQHEEKYNNKRKKIYKRSTNSIANKDKPDDNSDQTVIHDTVGAIVMDNSGYLAAAVSSGGISLKQPGRLGPAATYGAGCWAYNWASDTKPGVAIATSGSGEHLMKTLFSKECTNCIQNMDNASLGLSQAFKDHLLESEYLKHLDEKFGGAIALRQDKFDDKDILEIVWGHTTDSMCIGHMSVNDKKPRILISRLPKESKAGKSFTMEGRNVLFEKIKCKIK